MTEDRLQTLEEVQCKILAILESYLRLYDRQSQQLHDLQQLQNTHRLVHNRAVRNPLSLGRASLMTRHKFCRGSQASASRQCYSAQQTPCFKLRLPVDR